MSISADHGRASAEAAEWHARLAAADFGWEAFTLWLEASPLHRDAYDAIACLDREIDEIVPSLVQAVPANDSLELMLDAQRRWHVKSWAVGAVAAALAVALVSMLRPAPQSGAIEIASGAASGRTVTLKDGSIVQLDRNTRLTVLEGVGRHIAFDHGTARFAVYHDPARPFVIDGAGYEVRDVGTRFDISRTQEILTVAVAEGAVAVTAGAGDANALKAGQRMDIALASHVATVSAIDPASVSSWRSGRLEYADAPLVLVAADVGRYIDAPLRVDPGAAHLRFSGVLTIGDGTRLVGQLEKLLPVVVRHEDNAIILGKRGRS